MATVLLSNQLKTDITRKIEQKFEPKLAAAQRKFLNPDKAMDFYRCIVSKEVESLAAKLPVDMSIRSTKIWFRTSGRDDLCMALDSEKPMPSKYASSFSHTPLPLSPALLDAYNVWQAERAAILKERDTLVKEIKDLFNKTRTLQQVTAVWPSVLEYCGPETMRRYNAPQKKRFKASDHQIAPEAQLTLMKVRLTDV